MAENYFTTKIDNIDVSDEVSAYLKTLAPRRTKIMCKAIADAEAGDDRFLEIARKQRLAEFSPDEKLDVRELKIPAGGKSISALAYSPKSGGNGGALVYLHGGGWVIGSPNSCARICNDIALRSNRTVIAPDYSLAPKSKFPQPILEAADIFAWLQANAAELKISPEKIALGGDSAGGNIALAAAMKIADTNLAAPEKLVLYYPVGDSANPHGYDSWKKYATAFALDAQLMDAFSDAYFTCGSEKNSPLASPVLYEKFGEFPPALLFASGRDILHDQSVKLAETMRAQGAKVRFIDVLKAVHIYITMDGMDKSYKNALDETLEFLNRP